jgi:hypothetical protein
MVRVAGEAMVAEEKTTRRMLVNCMMPVVEKGS